MSWQKRVDKAMELYMEQHTADILHTMQHGRVEGWPALEIMRTARREFNPEQNMDLKDREAIMKGARNADEKNERADYMMTLFSGRVRRLVLEVCV